jgi:ornithine decarboxylase
VRTLDHWREWTSNGVWPPRLVPTRLNDIGEPAPFLALDCTVIEQRYRRFTSVVPGLELFYAVKCNATDGVLSTVRGAGGGFEIASAFELETVTAIGAEADRILYSNPVKPASHIAAAFARGVDRFAFDSEQELRKIAAVAPGARVYARLTVEDGHSLFPLSKKFGTSVEQATRLLALARHLGLVAYGVTFHVGSQCTDPQAWGSALARCGQVMANLSTQGIKLEMVDLGGGFPARYLDPVPTIEEIAAVIVDGVERLPYQPRLLCAEPGLYLVAESGVLATNVIGIEERDGQLWVFLDVGGYNGLMEALQTHGRWHFPMATSRPDDHVAPRVPFTVTGPSCDSSDTVFHDALLPATLESGDRLYLGSTGAYTLSYASHFNGFPPPRPVFVDAPTFVAC